MSFSTHDPYLNQDLQSFEYDSSEIIQMKLLRLQKSQSKWHLFSPEQRAKVVIELATKVEAHKEELARLCSKEMGKPVLQSRSELEKCIFALKTLAEFAPEALKQQTVSAHYKKTQIVPDSMGVVFSIQPWNFPYWQILRMSACAWMAGNVVLLKHSNLVAGSAKRLGEILDDPEIPLLINSPMNHDQAAEVIASPIVKMVTFTGSTKGGKAIAETAGRNLKKCVLELGGSDAYIVMKDCDLELAVKTCVKSRLINTGQSCIAGKRFFIESSLYETFRTQFLQEMSQMKAGNPLDESTQLGPLASSKFVDGIEEQIQKAIESGAKFHSVASRKDNFSSRGVLDFDKNLNGFEKEEIFGPVALFYRFEKLEDVIKVINEGPFGLGSGVFTQDMKKAHEIASAVNVGTFTINSFVQSDPRVPFGGTRESGFGREMGIQGLYDFVNWKVVGQA